MLTGRIGAPVSSARTKPPFLNGRSSPVGLRVPSGAIQIGTPLASFAFASWRLAIARSVFLRSIEMNPAALIAPPKTGTSKSSC